MEFTCSWCGEDIDNNEGVAAFLSNDCVCYSCRNGDKALVKAVLDSAYEIYETKFDVSISFKMGGHCHVIPLDEDIELGFWTAIQGIFRKHRDSLEIEPLPNRE